MLLMSCFSLSILLLHTYILLMYCLLFGLCIEMPSYVVYKGKVPGVYDDWEECRRQVHRFSGNSYKGYTTRAEAEARYARNPSGERRERRRNRMNTTFITIKNDTNRDDRNSLLCDGSLDDRYRLVM